MKLNLTAKGEEQKLVLGYLEANASDVLAEKINKGKKTLEGCWSFIESQAKKKAAGKRSIAVSDREVFGWAIHFFEEDDIKEAVKKADTTTEVKKVEEKPKKEPKPEPKKEETVDPRQITLFDFVGGNV